MTNDRGMCFIHTYAHANLFKMNFKLQATSEKICDLCCTWISDVFKLLFTDSDATFCRIRLTEPDSLLVQFKMRRFTWVRFPVLGLNLCHRKFHEISAGDELQRRTTALKLYHYTNSLFKHRVSIFNG